jgi:Transposase domain (DUF772)
LLPPTLREWLPANHLAWFVLDAVEQIDLTAFYAAYRADGHGRAAHDPWMMVALVLYAYSLGERSSRGIERRCLEDIAFRAGPRYHRVSRLPASPRKRLRGNAPSTIYATDSMRRSSAVDLRRLTLFAVLPGSGERATRRRSPAAWSGPSRCRAGARRLSLRTGTARSPSGTTPV